MRFPAVRMFSAEINAVRKFAEVEINQKKTKVAISPLGRKVGRIFHVGVLVQLDVKEDALIARVSDKYGGYTMLAHSTYHPQAYAVLKEATVPCYVAVVGKLRTREGFSKPFVRPELVAIVSSKEATIWEKEAMESTEKAIKAVENGTKLEYPEEEVKRLIELLRRGGDVEEEEEEGEKVGKEFEDIPYEFIEEELRL